ncbi:hypothetical protein RN001_013806 [Aquatica leii]|uniref:Fucosyltransferase n=1 Tax=Aquatica leii TaxID=1421715 RepID=A0AAN7P4Y0_9COLE|nr:hypothetical protein RN001_013806 [Aquatica leii]
MILSMRANQFKTLKIILAAVIVLSLIHLYSVFKDKAHLYQIYADKLSNGKWRNLSQEQIQNLSVLGRILYLDETPKPIISRLVPYKILLWRFDGDMPVRHEPNRSNPLQGCALQNCVITNNDTEIATADLVVFHLHRTRSVKNLPNRTTTKQIWAFLSDESPYNTFLYRTDNDPETYNNVFNWSMTYRITSDIPVAYGRTVALKNKGPKMDLAEWNKSKKQDVLVAIMMSNCNEQRMKYTKGLSEHMRVDIYGGCGTLKCDGHYYTDCKNTSVYKFYLAFENSMCEEYITEKLWWSGYHKQAIPIVLGGSKLSYHQSLPPNSYINVEDFPIPKDLATYLLHLNSSLSELEKFFEWKRNFQVINEHGYFESRSIHYCRICEALNYNSKQTKIYRSLNDFISVKNQCH